MKVKSILLLGLFLLSAAGCVNAPGRVLVKVYSAEALPNCQMPTYGLDQVVMDAWLHKCGASHASELVSGAVSAGQPTLSATGQQASIDLKFDGNHTDGREVRYNLVDANGDPYRGIFVVGARQQYGVLLSGTVVHDGQSMQIIYATVADTTSEPTH